MPWCESTCVGDRPSAIAVSTCADHSWKTSSSSSSASSPRWRGNRPDASTRDATRSGALIGVPALSWRWTPILRGSRCAAARTCSADLLRQTIAEVDVTTPRSIDATIPLATPAVIPRSSALTINRLKAALVRALGGAVQLGDERRGVERVVTEPHRDLLARGLRALGEQRAQDGAGL